MVMDMGQHVVQDYAQPLTLHQILVPGLEDRARAFPRLSTAKQLSPGERFLFLSVSNKYEPLFQQVFLNLTKRTFEFHVFDSLAVMTSCYTREPQRSLVSLNLELLLLHTDRPNLFFAFFLRQ